MTKEFFRVLGLALLIAAAGCGRQSSESPQRAERQEFIFARGADAQKLDPADVDDGESIKVLINICEGLLRFKDGSTEVEPCLAESWTVSDDGLLYTFKLRHGVKFHDGTSVNAAAVVWSFERQLNPKHPAHFPSAKFEYWGAMYSMVESVRATDDMTVEIRLKERHAPFLLNMAMFPVSILSPKAFDTYGDQMPRHPVGTGPFRFVQWNPGDRIVLAANDDYWAGRPRIDRLIYKVIPDSSSRLIQLASGQIHAMDGLNPNDLPVVQRNDRLQLLQFPGINVCYLSMNCEKPPFTDVRVRRAIAMAIRKEDLIESVYRGTAIPAILPMPPIVFGFDKSIEDYPNDIEAAKRLLAEYRDAFRATMGVTPNGPPPTPLENLLDLLVMPNPRPYLPDPIRAAELIKGDLERLGLKIRITVSGDWGTHLAKTRNGEHQMALLGWVSDNGDPDNFLGVLLGSEQARKGAALNISFYKNPALDDLLQQARRELDTAKRAALYHQAQKIIHDDCPMVPLAHAVDSVAMHRNVHGLVLQPTGDLRFHHVRLER